MTDFPKGHSFNNLLTQKMYSGAHHGRHMARKSLIAAPLQAEIYRHRPECFYALVVIRKHTQILHYQGFYGYMPAR